MTLRVKMSKMKNHLGQAALYNAYTLPQVHIRMYVHAYYSMWTRTRPRKPQSAVSKTFFNGRQLLTLPVQCMPCMAHDHCACTLALHISSNDLLGR